VNAVTLLAALHTSAWPTVPPVWLLGVWCLVKG
jgi:hypothetical protein